MKKRDAGDIAGPELRAPWHTLTAAAALAELASDAGRGLGDADAAGRLCEEGPNAIATAGRRGLAAMIAAQFANVMILILAVAAIVSGIIGDIGDALTILAIVILNTAIGAMQDFRAERALTDIKRLAVLNATVLRGGRHATIPASGIVPGDIVLLEAGAVVPADLLILETAGLGVNEAALTGEAAAVEKCAGALPSPGTALADRRNMLFKGSTIARGRATGLAVATGMRTELGKIAALVDRTPAPTPLQRRLTVLGRQLAFAALAICTLIFAAGILRGEPAMLMLMTALSLAVAAIPEAMPAVVTAMLSLGARAMARRSALIRHLPAVETLGSVAYICTDKTGTLTQNRMRVTALYPKAECCETIAPERDPALRQMLTAAALCNDVGSDAHGAPVGEPTEIALWQMAADAGFEKTALARIMPRRVEFPFDSDRRRMTTIHSDGDAFIAYTKGAPETVLACCSAMADSGETPLDRAHVLAVADALASRGLRVMALASRRWERLPNVASVHTVEQHLTLLGLVGMLDPPRPEVRAAIARCKSAGIATIMITGDHALTARAIAMELGMLEPDDAVLTGQEIDLLSDKALASRAGQVKVYARVDPAQKIRIVDAIRAAGHYVAMVGDGINDAPALARADIGVAMGKIGTDVAREAASVILLDDNFATIAAAVEEGRRIFGNIRKFLRYAMTGNSAEIWLIALAPLVGLPIPLQPIHILWINLVTDGLPGLALTAEPAERGAMQVPPRPPEQSFFGNGLWQHIVWAGLAIAALSLLVQAYAIHFGNAHWQTMIFSVLVFSQMAYIMAIRSERESLFRQGMASNRPLLFTVLLTIALQLAIVYLPALNAVFHTAPLAPEEIAACLLLSSSIFFIVEAEKWCFRRGYIPR